MQHPDVTFYHVRLRSGASGGFGFQCSRCGLQFPHSLQPGMEIRHCARVDVVPTAKEIKDERTIGPASAMPTNVIPIAM